VLNRCGFRDFIAQYFDEAYSSLFVDQIQPLDPRFTYCVVHATAAINGKRNESTATMQEIIAEKFCVTPYLSEIAGCLHEGLSPMKPCNAIAESRKQHVRALSLNQLFLNVCQSRRRDTSLQAKSEASLFCDLARTPSFEQLEARLKQTFNRQLNLVDLRHIARIAGGRVFLFLLGNSASRCETLAWFGQEWTLLEPVWMEMVDNPS
jgi:hypothetical protein